MYLKIAGFIILFSLMFSLSTAKVFAQEADNIIEIAPIKSYEVEKIIIYYFPMGAEADNSVSKADLKNNYLYKLEIVPVFTLDKNYQKVLLSRMVFEPASDRGLDYRVLVEFYGKDGIILEYGLGYYLTNMEVNGTFVKGKKEYYEFVKEALPFDEVRKSIDRAIAKLE